MILLATLIVNNGGPEHVWVTLVQGPFIQGPFVWVRTNVQIDICPGKKNVWAKINWSIARLGYVAGEVGAPYVKCKAVLVAAYAVGL